MDSRGSMEVENLVSEFPFLDAFEVQKSVVMLKLQDTNVLQCGAPTTFNAARFETLAASVQLCSALLINAGSIHSNMNVSFFVDVSCL